MSIVQNRIENSLNSIDPDLLLNYLREKGWEEEEKIDDIAYILSINTDETKYSLLLPIDNKISDYDYRVLDILNVLEKVEKKDKSELIRLSNQNDKNKLKQFISTLDRKSASSYRKFLTSLRKAEINLYTSWGSVNPQFGGYAYLEYSHILSTIEFINKIDISKKNLYYI